MRRRGGRETEEGTRGGEEELGRKRGRKGGCRRGRVGEARSRNEEERKGRIIGERRVDRKGGRETGIGGERDAVNWRLK